MLHMESPSWNHKRDLWNGWFENNGPRPLSLPSEHERKVKAQEELGVYDGVLEPCQRGEELLGYSA